MGCSGRFQITFQPGIDVESAIVGVHQAQFRNIQGRSYKYQAIDSNMDQLLSRLGEAYRACRVAVTNEIYSKTSARLKSFADAFRLRRDQ